jgi:hypothetical protein
MPRFFCVEDEKGKLRYVTENKNEQGKMKRPLLLITLATTSPSSTAFLIQPVPPLLHTSSSRCCDGGDGGGITIQRSRTSTRLHFFDKLDKAFETDGPLGKGITVGKVQIALSVTSAERSSQESIFAILEQFGRDDNKNNIGSQYDNDYSDGRGDSKLSQMCHEICLALLRKSDDWLSACSTSIWYRESDMGKAESLYNQWADREACKFEKEYIPPPPTGGGSSSTIVDGTVAVISLVIEIQGDETNFDRAGFSISETKSVLTSIASDCRVEGGDCLNAFEVFWTPSEPTEVVTERDTIIDFPELITL